MAIGGERYRNIAPVSVGILEGGGHGQEGFGEGCLGGFVDGKWGTEMAVEVQGCRIAQELNWAGGHVWIVREWVIVETVGVIGGMGACVDGDLGTSYRCC